MVNRLDYVRTCEIETLIVAIEFLRAILECVVTVILFLEIISLDHRAHGTV